MTTDSATIQVAVADGTSMQAYLARPAARQAPTGVIIAHELFAVNPDIRRVADDLAAAGWLNEQPGIERVAMIGFSAGGHLSYLAACRLPISRTAVLYGGWLTSTDIPMSRPTPTIELTPGISGRLLYLTGEADALIGPGQRAQIRDALKAAGPGHEMVSYPGVAHAFFWPGTQAFSQQARDDAWSRIMALLAT
jgi:carboxymethylenebutenolidase